MSEQINWCEELSWIGDYRFPLQRKNQSYIDLLTAWMDRYCLHIDSCKSLLDDKKVQIKRFSKHLLECHKMYLNGCFAEAYSLFNQIMDEVQDSLLSIDLGMSNSYSNVGVGNYFRIRQGNRAYSYLEMLHIPLSHRKFASTGRFSAPGMPCTYLASAKEICWYECGMPCVFQIASYKAKNDIKNKGKLLQLDINPLSVKKSLLSLHGRKAIDENRIKKISEQIFFVLPLIATCSVSVNKKDGSFVEEYVIPQMLMAWLRNNSTFIGVRYPSHSPNDLVRCNCGHNIAIPVRDEKNKGYSAEICSLFDFSEDTKSETIDLSDRLQKKFSQEIAKLELFLEEITYEMQHFIKEDNPSVSCATVELYSKLSAICESLLSLLNDFSKYTEQSSYGIVLTLAEINNWGTLLKEHTKNHENDYDVSANKYIASFNQDILELMNSISTFFRMGIVWDD